MALTRISIKQVAFRQWLWVICVSAIGIGGLNLGLFTGLQYTNPTNGSLIMALSPLVTSIIVCITQRKYPSLPQMLSILVSLSGVLVVITNGNLSILLSFSLNHGDKLVFLGMFSWSLYTFFSQGISKWMPVIPYTFVGMSCSAVITGLVCLASSEANLISELIHSSILTNMGVIYIGLFCTVAGYLLWLSGVHHLGSSTASLFFNLVPVFSILASYMLGHSVSLLQLIGVLIVIIGLMLPRLIQRKNTLVPVN